VEDGAPVLYVRQGGLRSTLDERRATLRTWLGEGETLDEVGDAAVWTAAQSFAWVPDGWALVKSPITLNTVPVLEQVLASQGALRRYMAGASQAWIAWPGELSVLDSYLTQLQLGGLVIRGQTGWPFLGARAGASLAARVKRVLDPFNRFPTL
ncbi:MAG: hypothetical protein R6W76_21755, partial [Caldilinea sp.]